MLITRKPQSGVTLVELLIGMLIGVIVLAGAISVFLISLKGQGDNIQLARLNQDMRAIMDIMVRDIRRAGFVTDRPQNYKASLQNNPFFGPTTDLVVHDYGSDSNNCILYSYNRDNDKPPVVDAEEHFGFRRTADGTLEMRSDGVTNESCDNTTWSTMTEPAVEITVLTFILTSSTLNVSSMMTDTDGDGCFDGEDELPFTANSNCKNGTYGNGVCDPDPEEACNNCTRDGSPDPACLYVRHVTIILTGRLRNDPSVTQSISQRIRIRNDKFSPAIP